MLFKGKVEALLGAKSEFSAGSVVRPLALVDFLQSESAGRGREGKKK